MQHNPRVYCPCTLPAPRPPDHLSYLTRCRSQLRLRWSKETDYRPLPEVSQAKSVMPLRCLPLQITLVCLVAAAVPVASPAADGGAQAPLTDPAGLASFTRAIQPLLLNRCAAGACHGGPASAQLQLTRGPTRGRIDRPTTLVNLQRLSEAVASKGGDRRFLQAVLRNHPPDMLPGRPAGGLLSVRERQLLATWLAAFTPPPASAPQADADKQAVAQRVTPANFEQPASPRPQTHSRQAQASPALPVVAVPATDRPNRFRQLLEQAANPPRLPPPQVTKGLQLDQVLPDDFPPLPPAADDSAAD